MCCAIPGWGISEGPGLGSKLKKANKPVQADPSQFHVGFCSIFAIMQTHLHESAVFLAPNAVKAANPTHSL